MEEKKLRRKRWALDLAPPHPKVLQAMRGRIGRWRDKRNSWRLWEACDLAFHVFPVKGFRNFWFFRSIESEMLVDDAERSFIAGTLSVRHLGEPFEGSWVDPWEFGRWAAGRADLIDETRAAVFAELFPPAQSLAELESTRRKILESGYSTPELEALFSAIEHFWLPVVSGDQVPPNDKVVIDWLMSVKKQSKSAAERIATTIRAPDRKRGGRQSPSQKSQ